MKTLVVKYLLPLIFLIIAFAGVAHMTTDLLRGSRTDLSMPTLQVRASAGEGERGRHLFQTRGCVDCHGEDAGGKIFIDDPLMGTIAGSNLTKGNGGNGPRYKSITDWHRAIRYGLNPEGHPLLFMPSNEYTSLSKRDTAALVLYLYNLPAVDRVVPLVKPGPLARMLYLMGQLPILFPYASVDEKVQQADDVPEALNADYGKYLAASCTGCHGQKMTGGRIKGVPPSWPKASDLTSRGRLAEYTEEGFKKVMREGVTPSGRQIDAQFMPWPSLSKMSDVELGAIYLYLRTL